jgi:excisionase family DNA binding protein
MSMTAKIVRNGQEIETKLLTPAEVANTFRVDPKTVTRWAKAGKLTAIRTLGGHRRYLEVEVKALLESGRSDRTEDTELSVV